MTDVPAAQEAWPHDVAMLIADDHHLVRDGMRLMVGAMFPHARLFDAADGDELMRHARRLGGHALALVDLNMPGMDKGALLASLARDLPGLRLVVVSALTSPDVIRRALALPTVYAFVPKSADAQRMRRALDAALNGQRLPYEVPPEESEPPADAGLTPRMQEIRLLLRQGMSNKAIAQKLNLSEGTVKNYMTDIFRVLSVTNRTQAARYNPDTS